MYRSRVYVVLLLIACLALTHAQLTFTSSWGGKRSGSLTGTLNCRNDDALAAIYRMIQNEAEKFLICQKQPFKNLEWTHG